MKRKEFMTKGVVALGGVVVLTGVTASVSKNGTGIVESSEDCEMSPEETKGPFPNKTPTDYVRENIIGDRKGVPLRITMTILNNNDGCKPLSNTMVDVWHCDSKGHYSEYGGYGIQSEDMTERHFLRGRQITDINGRVSFISIFPGYYRGRAPHIHVEVLGNSGKSILATQIAFPETVCNTVYATEYYGGRDYISNTSDMVFRDSLNSNLANSITGNLSDGFTLLKNIVVDA
ncbi:MAG TPA: hypothetical protein VKN36_14545 [Eudoraea sp.]|nr:hypothetical protein [Eudoraea sp.]